MNKWQLTDFKPKWAMKDESPFGDMPDVGYPVEAPPRLLTRLLSSDGSNSFSSATLSDTITITQHVFDFVAYEVVHGVNRDMDDLRTIDTKVQTLSKLHIEPFEVGSFIIPAEFTTEPVEFVVNGIERVIYAKQVLEHFNIIMEKVSGNGFDCETSIGTIRCIESLNRILRRDASQLEYQTSGYSSESLVRPKRFIVNDSFLRKVSEVRKYRQEVEVKHGSTLEGVIIALDFEHRRLKLRQSGDHIVKGNFLPLMERTLEGLLCKRVRLRGAIHYRKTLPMSIDAVAAELLPDDAPDGPPATS